MKRILPLLSACTALLLAGSPFAAGREASPWLSQPALSPDAREIAFVHGGDLWTVPAQGGEARLLVSHAADDRRPLWSPDGRELLFVSDRTGNGDLYVLTLVTGALRRLTFDDGVESPEAWSPDGRWVYFSSSTAEVAGALDVLRVPAAGGTPMTVSGERYTSEFEAAPAPGGDALLLVARGMPAQWWRNGHSHIDETEIWLMRHGATPVYTRLVDRGARSRWPQWAADGRHFWFVSDRSGSENLWSADLAGTAAQVTRYTSGRVLWPSASRDGRLLAFERDFGLWTLDPATGEARRLEVALRGSPAGAGTEYRKLTGGAGEMALSPDGKKIAFVVRGEVFAVSAADGGEAARVTRTTGAELQLVWAPDSRRIAYISTRAGDPDVYLYDFTAAREERLTGGPAADTQPQFSPDGKSLAFLRDGSALHVMDLASRTARPVASGHLDLPIPIGDARSWTWSPDGRWIAYLAQGERMFRNAHVVNVGKRGAASIQVSFLANIGGSALRWSPDGEFLLFDTGQRTETGRVARVDLVPRTPRFREQQFRDLFKDDKKPEEPRGGAAAGAAKQEEREANPAASRKSAARKPVEIVAEGLRQRLQLLPAEVDVRGLELSADGKQLLLVASAEGSENLYLFSLDELAKEPAVARQLTSTTGSKASPQFSPDGKTVYCLDDGAIVSIPVESRQPRTIAFSAGMEVDFGAEKQVVFDQAWGWLRTHFHDARMNGVDWDAVRASFAPRVEATRTPTELQRLLSMMVGELNASHLGVSSGVTPQRTTGRIGLRFDPAEHERNGALRVTGLVPLGPAAITRQVKVGDYLVAVDGVALSPENSLERLLEHRVGREVTLALARDARGSGRREVRVRPVTQMAEKDLVYREWVERNRALVARLSGGRLGYVHMPDMGTESLLRLASDLDAENMTREGVVFDVRNNNGGFVNAYALDILSRRHYLDMTYRGWPTANARTILGQRSLERPTVLLTNQHSLSDAEDFTEGYRALGLGKVVGEPTAGWIIYTTNQRMIDGSVVRLPFITVTTAKGEPMEMHPRPVDIDVRRALGEDLAGKDSQLERAVTELLAQLGGPKSAGK